MCEAWDARRLKFSVVYLAALVFSPAIALIIVVALIIFSVVIAHPGWEIIVLTYLRCWLLGLLRRWYSGSGWLLGLLRRWYSGSGLLLGLLRRWYSGSAGCLGCCGGGTATG